VKLLTDRQYKQIETNASKTHGRPQAWERGALAPPPPPPSGNVVTSFCAVMVTAKIWSNYLHIIFTTSRRLGFWSFAIKPPPEIHPWIPLEDFRPRVPRPLICPPLEKILRGAAMSKHNLLGGYKKHRGIVTDQDKCAIPLRQSAKQPKLKFGITITHYRRLRTRRRPITRSRRPPNRRS